MASLRSSQCLSLLLVALLVCQAFTMPAMATVAPWVPKDLTTPRAPKAPQGMVTIQGDGKDGGDKQHVDNDNHGLGEHGEYGHGGHGYGDDNGGRHG